MTFRLRALRNGGMERNEEINEWAEAAVRALLCKCMQRAFEVLWWMEEWE